MITSASALFQAFAMAVTLLVTGGTAVLAVAFTAMLGYVMARCWHGLLVIAFLL